MNESNKKIVDVGAVIDSAKYFWMPFGITLMMIIIMLSDGQVAPHLQNRNWLIEAGRNGAGPREVYFKVNNILGLVRACQQGLGIAALPDYLVEENNRLVQLFGESDSIQLDTYFVYPEELKSVARVQVFRDFVVSKAQRWPS